MIVINNSNKVEVPFNNKPCVSSMLLHLLFLTKLESLCSFPFHFCSYVI